MASEFLKRLPSIFDGPEADYDIPTRLGWMHLTKREDGLAVALFIKGDEHSEFTRVVFPIGAVLDLDEREGFHAQKNHSIGVARAIASNHIKSPGPAWIEIDLPGFDRHALWPKPVLYLVRVSPGGIHEAPRRIDDSA